MSSNSTASERANPTGPHFQEPSLTDRFFIKPGYQINPRPHNYCDSPEDSRKYQLSVYRFAAELAQRPSVTSVLDIGCGLGTKLVEFVRPHCQNITGVDSPETIARCTEDHAAGRWIPADLEAPAVPFGGPFDLIISADVIEHLLNPDRLLEVIHLACHEHTTIVLSTPERDLRRGSENMGPPANPAHVREWNAAEFLAYLQDRGLAILDSRIVDLCEGMTTCHLVVGRSAIATS